MKQKIDKTPLILALYSLTHSLFFDSEILLKLIEKNNVVVSRLLKNHYKEDKQYGLQCS
jgi:hypothetical protein